MSLVVRWSRGVVASCGWLRRRVGRGRIVALVRSRWSVDRVR
ncbi:hypothetical protein ACXZ9C_10990 [Streptococcus agalactiae]